LTIEPVLTFGSGEVKRLQDGWTEVSMDGKNCAQFELTVEVTDETPRILTFPKNLAESLDTWFFF
jgi:methionyl aminopeptidase